jgi:phosphoesterase RecJ-like protein
MQNAQELKKLLAIPKDIVITSHRNPDGDAIGSSLALAHYLSKNGHTVHVLFPSEYPEFLNWMSGANDIVIHDLEAARAASYLQKADLFFALDYNSLDRIDAMGEIAMQLNCPMVMIDHHPDPENFADFSLSDTSASSTAELVYDFINLMGDAAQIDLETANSLYVGILSDTGSFKYATTPKLFRLVAHLNDLGVDNTLIQDLTFNNLVEKNLRLLGHCLANHMEIIEAYQTGIITLTREDYENFNIQRGDTEGIVNYLLMLRNVKLAAFITEQPKIIKLSLRSKGDFSVQEIARKHFNGGGHRNASGGAVYGTLAQTVNKFKSLLPDYASQLQPHPAR